MATDEVPIQVPWQWKQRPATIDRKYAELAFDEYFRKHKSQSFERIHERGGFGVTELMDLLLERMQRLEQHLVDNNSNEGNNE